MRTAFFGRRALIGLLIFSFWPAYAAKLARIDREIATHSGVLGANRLADDPGDATGRILLELCGSLHPTNETYLLTVARLEKGLQISKGRTKVTVKKLVSVMRSRAETLREEAGEGDDAALAKRSLLYFRVVEHFFPEDNAVLLGIMKLKVEGVEGTLNELLKAPIAVAETTVPAAEAAEADSGRSESLFRKAKALDEQGTTAQSQSLWKQFLAVEPEGERKTAVEQGWLSVAVEEVPLEMQYWRVFWSGDGRRVLYQSHNKWYTFELATCKSTEIEGMGGVTDVSGWSADGRLISTTVRGGDMYVFVYELQALDKARATTTEPVAFGGGHGFTPDGASILFMAGKNDKRVPTWAMATVNLETGRAEVIPPFDTPGRNAVSKMSWMPDGKSVVFTIFNSQTRDDYALFVGRLGFTAGPVELSSGAGVLNWPEASPDGRGVAYAVGAEHTKRLSRIAAADGSVSPIAVGRGEAPLWSPDGRKLALLVFGDGPSRLEIRRLGGVDHRPVEFAAKQTGHAMDIAVRNRGQKACKVDLTCELFDPSSFRIDLATVHHDDISLSSGGVRKFKIDLRSARQRGTYTVKLTAVTGAGARAIELVDVIIR